MVILFVDELNALACGGSKRCVFLDTTLVGYLGSDISHMASRTITVYEPDSREKLGFIASCATIFRNIYAYREMIIVLFKRDFFASYRKSFLGMTWLFVAPIMAA